MLLSVLPKKGASEKVNYGAQSCQRLLFFLLPSFLTKETFLQPKDVIDARSVGEEEEEEPVSVHQTFFATTVFPSSRPDISFSASQPRAGQEKKEESFSREEEKDEKRTIMTMSDGY